MADVFVSYKREDREVAEAIERTLTTHGFDVWRDAQLRGGETFTPTIFRELLTARCVVLCWSQRAAGSAWVQAEAQIGWRRKILVPVLLDGTPPAEAWNGAHCIDVSAWPLTQFSEETDQIVRSVARTMHEVDPAALSIETIVDPVSLDPLPQLHELALRSLQQKPSHRAYRKPANRSRHLRTTVPALLVGANLALMGSSFSWMLTQDQTRSAAFLLIFAFATLLASSVTAWTLAKGVAQSACWALAACLLCIPLCLLGAGALMTIAAFFGFGRESATLVLGMSMVLPMVPLSLAAPWMARRLRLFFLQLSGRRSASIYGHDLTDHEVQRWWTSPRRRNVSAGYGTTANPKPKHEHSQ